MNFLVLLILSFCISSTKCVNYERPQVPPHLRVPDEKSEPINASFPITFYKDAYLDFRTSPPRLRIFALAGCVLENQYLVVDVFRKGFRSPKALKIFGDAHKANCRDSSGISATPCFYVANTFVANLTSSGDEFEKIVIHMDRRKVSLRVKTIENRFSEEGITVCLQPIYYYTQWQNILLYLEAWRAQGATRFIVYFHSGTKEVKQVLDYFRDTGLMEVRPWPSFGALPPEISGKFPDFDSNTYSFSYFLAMNLCILDIKTSIGTVSDLDEIIVPKNGNLLDYAKKEMEKTNVGALSFENVYVKLEPNLYESNDFSGLEKPIFLEKWGARKYIFNASTIDIAQVHFARSFLDFSKIEKNSSDGALLHYRFDVQVADLSNATVIRKSFNFFPNQTKSHIENLKDTAIRIFGTPNLPKVNFNLINVLNKCIQTIKNSGKCKATGGLCKAEMDRVYNWIYDKTESIFLAGKFE
ncbi:unnamed protein product [Caenorhabditis nigoni]